MTAYNKIGWSLPASRPSSLRSGGTFIAALAVLGLALTAAAAHAQSVWQGASTDYNAATNWAPNTVPAAAGQSATFANTGIGSIAVKSAQAPDSWTFAPSAHGYAIGGVATVTFGGAGIIDNATGQTISISNAIAGTGGVLLNSPGGTLSLSGANSYTGGTTLDAGTLLANHASLVNNPFVTGVTFLTYDALGTAPITFGGGNLLLGVNGANLANDLNLSPVGETISAAHGIATTIGGDLSSGNVNIPGGAIVFGSAGNDGTILFEYSDFRQSIQPQTIEVADGTLAGNPVEGALTVDSNLADFLLTAAKVTVDAGATLNLNNTGVNFRNLQGAGTVESGTGALAISQGDFSGTISNSGGLVKTTPGVLTLSGANTYTGGTFLNGGTLIVDHATSGVYDALSTGAITFNGGNLVFGVSGTLTNTLNLSATGETISAAHGVTSNIASIVNLTAATLVFGSAGNDGTIAYNENLSSGGFFGEPSIEVAAGTLTQTDGHGALSFLTENVLTTTVDLGATVDFNNTSSAISNLQGAGNVTAGTGMLTIAGGNFSGVISGTGGLTKEFTRTLTLSGANTYSGRTLVNSGVLRAGANNVFSSASAVVVVSTATLDLAGFNETIGSLAGAGDVTLGAGVLNTGGDNTSTTFSGVISGSGGLVKAGSGAFTLTGTNTYSGGTMLLDGMIVVENNAALGTGLFQMAQGTAMSFPSSGNVTVPENMTISGDPTMMLPAGATETISGAIADGAAAGIMEVQGPGTLVLTGANTYSGGTLILGGTLIGNTTSIQGNILDNASLIFDQTANGIYAGVLSGTGSLTIQGTGGGVTLTGNSSGFAGNTLVSGVALVIGPPTAPGASLGSSVTVQNGGTVSGLGTIGSSLANASGTVMPGGTIGTLTVGGNYAQNSAGRLQIQLTPAGVSALAVNGAASLDGKLEVAPVAGAYAPNSRFAILTAGGGVSGSFAQFANDMPALTVLVVYLPNEVELMPSGFVGQTRNEIAAANVLNTAFPSASGDFAATLTDAATLPAAQIPRSLASLGGQIYANLAEVSLQDRRLFLGAMDERVRHLGDGGSPGVSVLGGLVSGGWGGGANALQMAALSNAISDPQVAQIGGSTPRTAALPGDIWARGFDQFGGIDSNGGALGVNYSTGGGAIGADLIHTPVSLLGIAVSGGQSSLSTKSLTENGTISFVQLGVYGAQAFNYGIAADGAMIYAHDFYDVSRGIVLPGTSRTASSNHGGDDVVLDFGVSRPMQHEGWQITPRAGLSYFRIGESDFSETGASSLDLTVNPKALDALRSRVGVSVSKPMMFGATRILPELRAAWTHDFLDDRGGFAAVFAGAPAVSFQQIGATTGRDAAEFGAGVSVALSQSMFPGELSTFLQYDATLAAHQTNNVFAAGLRLTW